NAMTVSTLDEWGPSSRIVLLKGLDERGLLFFTDYDSAKGKQLRDDPRIAVNFPWQDMERQVRIRGRTEVASPEDSDSYFAVRPRGSQIGATVSKQSQPVADRKQMQAEYDAAEAEFEGRDIPRPEHWGGFRVHVFEIESWQGQQNRFHDRWVFRRSDGSHEPAALSDASARSAVRRYPRGQEKTAASDAAGTDESEAESLDRGVAVAPTTPNAGAVKYSTRFECYGRAGMVTASTAGVDCCISFGGRKGPGSGSRNRHGRHASSAPCTGRTMSTSVESARTGRKI